MGEKSANEIMVFYGFTEDELAFVLETSAVKVRKRAEEGKGSIEKKFENK